MQSIAKLLASDLPPGVTHRDVELFKKTRERAIQVLFHIILLFPPSFKCMCCMDHVFEFSILISIIIKLWGQDEE